MKAAEDLIKHFEGLRLDAYKCPSGKWTIGYGHTEGVVKGMSISAADADRLLKKDLETFGWAVLRYVHVPLNENQRAALVSLAFNIGPENFRTSTLVRRLNAGDYVGASHEFERWVHHSGSVVPGLVRRREAELRLFLTPQS